MPPVSPHPAEAWRRPPRGGWIEHRGRSYLTLMRDIRQRRTNSDDENVEAEFWGDIDSVKARVASGLVLIGAVAGITGLVWLGRGLL